MKKSRLVMVFIFCFLGGVVLAQMFSWVFMVIVVIIFFLVIILRSNKALSKIGVWMMVGLMMGFSRYLLSAETFGPGEIAYYRDTGLLLKVEGGIGSEVDVRSDRQYLTLESQRVFYQESWHSVQGKILIKAPRYPAFDYGDFLQITCFLRSPPEFEKFSYARFLAKDDIYVVCYQPQIFLLQQGNGHVFWKGVLGLKSQLSVRINELFSEPEASLVAGLLLGLRRHIPATILDDFNRAGLTHVLAISGYNITLMITIFGIFFRHVSRKIRFLGISMGIGLLLLFTGFSSSIIRAAWMGFLVKIGELCGRKADSFLMLMVSAFIMVFLNPRLLLSDLSFELSFTATLGLILGMPFLEKWFEKYGSMWPAFLREGLAATLGAQVFTMPLILYYLGRISVVAPLANIIFLPLIPFIMLFAFTALIFSFVCWPFATFFAALAWLLLKIFLKGIEGMAHLPFASFEI